MTNKVTYQYFYNIFSFHKEDTKKELTVEYLLVKLLEVELLDIERFGVKQLKRGE